LKTIKEKQLFRENRRLKALLRVARNDVIALVNELELAEGECLMRYYDFLEAAQNRGGALLNPAPIKLKGEYGIEKDYDEHTIQIANVIAIKSQQKVKIITLSRPLYESSIKDKFTELVCRQSFNPILKKLDPLEMWLFSISRTWKINVKHFKLKNFHLFPYDQNMTSEFSKISEIKLSKDNATVFKEKKKYIAFLTSFQNIRVRSDFGMIH